MEKTLPSPLQPHARAPPPSLPLCPAGRAGATREAASSMLAPSPLRYSSRAYPTDHRPRQRRQQSCGLSDYRRAAPRPPPSRQLGGSRQSRARGTLCRGATPRCRPRCQRFAGGARRRPDGWRPGGWRPGGWRSRRLLEGSWLCAVPLLCRLSGELRYNGKRDFGEKVRVFVVTIRCRRPRLPRRRL
jgi:hypothetical protein